MAPVAPRSDSCEPTSTYVRATQTRATQTRTTRTETPESTNNLRVAPENLRETFNTHFENREDKSRKYARRSGHGHTRSAVELCASRVFRYYPNYHLLIMTLCGRE